MIDTLTCFPIVTSLLCIRTSNHHSLNIDNNTKIILDVKTSEENTDSEHDDVIQSTSTKNAFSV